MSNVLPESAAKTVRHGYFSRMLLVAGLVLIAAAFAAALSLIPSYVLLHAQVVALNTQTNALKNATSTSEDQDRAMVADLRNELAALSGIDLAGSRSLEAIKEVMLKKPAGVSITAIVYMRNADSGTIVFSGVAPARTAISEFVDALKKDPLFTSASVPLQELAGIGDGGFHITVTGAF